MIHERHLFGPGPSNPYPEATNALSRPLLGHLDPEFLRIMDETCELLRQAWGTSNARTLPISATGSAGMEAAFVNTVHDGDVVVVGVNGLFGQRMCDVAARCGAEVVAVEHEWGQPVDVQRMLDAHPAPALYAAVHAETSTGVRSDIAALGAAKGDALLDHRRGHLHRRHRAARRRVGDRRRLRRHPEVPRRRARPRAVHDQRPGLRPPRGEAPQLVPRPRPARRLRRRGLRQGGGRTYHHTAPVAMVVSLHAGLTRIAEEGLENVWARHHEAGQLLQDGLQELGLELFAAEGHRLPELTTVRVPDGVDSAAVRARLLERYDIEIGAGVGQYASTVWRIGLMGHNARPEAALLVLAALEEAIKA